MGCYYSCDGGKSEIVVGQLERNLAREKKAKVQMSDDRVTQKLLLSIARLEYEK